MELAINVYYRMFSIAWLVSYIFCAGYLPSVMAQKVGLVGSALNFTNLADLQQWVFTMFGAWMMYIGVDTRHACKNVSMQAFATASVHYTQCCLSRPPQSSIMEKQLAMKDKSQINYT